MYLHRDHTSWEMMLGDVNYWFAVWLDNQQSLLSIRIDSDPYWTEQDVLQLLLFSQGHGGASYMPSIIDEHT